MREAIQRHAEHASSELIRALERQLLCYYERWDYQSIIRRHESLDQEGPDYWILRPNDFGRAQYYILSAIPPNVRSCQVHSQVMMWSRKFEGVQRPRNLTGGFVRSPISWHETEHMSDQDWLSAIKGKYRKPGTSDSDWLKGGARQLAQLLEEQAHKHGKRFANLLPHFPCGAFHGYFSAVLRGITKREKYQCEEKDVVPATESASLEQIYSTIRLTHARWPENCGVIICSSVRLLADRSWPREILDMIVDYADRPLKRTVLPDIKEARDVLTQGRSSLPGAAVLAIGSLLYYDPKRIEFYRSTLLEITDHPSPYIKAVVAYVVIMLLSIDNDMAVEMFKKLTNDMNEPLLFATNYVRALLYRIAKKDFAMISNLVEWLFNHENQELAGLGAELHLLHWYHSSLLNGDPETQSPVKEICDSSIEAHRQGAAMLLAKIFVEDSGNWGVAIEPLTQLLGDCSPDVRIEAENALRRVDPMQSDSRLRTLIQSFLGSSPERINLHLLVETMNELPSVFSITQEVFQVVDICCSQLLDHERSQGTEGDMWLFADIGISMITRLLIQLYDEGAEYRERCLDGLDRLLWSGYSNIAETLRAIDRDT